MDELYKIQRDTHSRTLLHAKLSLNIAWYSLIKTFADPSGVLNARYEIDRYNNITK